MHTIRAVATNEVVRAAFPRPTVDGQEVGLAAGKAIDETLSRYGHEFSLGRKPGTGPMVAHAGRVFDDALAELGSAISPTDRKAALAPVPRVLKAFRSSVLFGLPRPRSRMILINAEVGVYAQPDYWDGRERVYEMKSYRAIPPKPDVALQLRLFQLAFPRFHQSLVCIDRHSDPVEVLIAEIPPPSPEEGREALRLAWKVGREVGKEKVLEYVDNPVVHYTVEPGGEPLPHRAPADGASPAESRGTGGTGTSGHETGPPGPAAGDGPARK